MLSPETHYPIETLTKEVVFLKNFITSPSIHIGDYTYYHGRSTPENFETQNVLMLYTCELIIGKFCQIADGTQFIMSDANHQISGFSTYPFFIFGDEWANYVPDLPQKGDTIIGNDVWFGHESVIMPGVTIGDGAIIAAKALVTKNVPPYTIVGGNPAKVIRKRFDDATIAKLLEIKWWDWDYAKITANIPAITSADIKALES